MDDSDRHDRDRRRRWLLIAVGGMACLAIAVAVRFVIGARRLDLEMRHDLADALGRIEVALGERDKSPADMHRLLGRGPDKPIAKKDGRWVEEYAWKSRLRSHRIYLLYNQGKPRILDSMYLNEMP